MDDEDEIETASKKWAHLLIPIKDLAENLKIDIAQELEVYLTELRLIKTNSKNLNFTEGIKS